MTQSIHDAVASELGRAGLDVRPELVQDLARYLALLERWGQHVDLTARPEAEVVARRLLPDALMLALALPPRPLGLVDAGAGNGLVGLVLALVRPADRVMLVEVNRRRCSFLHTAIHALPLQGRVTVREGRLEQLTLPPQDIALSRATWPPEDWLARGASLVMVQGLVVAFLAEGAAAPRHPALQLERTVGYALVDGTGRQLVLYRRFT